MYFCIKSSTKKYLVIKDDGGIKMKEFDTYIFDLDGTLLYTLDDLTASTNYAMRAFSLPEHTTEEVRMMVGNGIKNLLNVLYQEEKTTNVMKIFIIHLLNII